MKAKPSAIVLICVLPIVGFLFMAQVGNPPLITIGNGVTNTFTGVVEIKGATNTVKSGRRTTFNFGSSSGSAPTNGVYTSGTNGTVIPSMAQSAWAIPSNTTANSREFLSISETNGLIWFGQGTGVYGITNNHFYASFPAATPNYTPLVWTTPPAPWRIRISVASTPAQDTMGIAVLSPTLDRSYACYRASTLMGVQRRTATGATFNADATTISINTDTTRPSIWEVVNDGTNCSVLHSFDGFVYTQLVTQAHSAWFTNGVGYLGYTTAGASKAGVVSDFYRILPWP